jgi:uncharacterized protein YabN with tetrapyrrole methylase and pyrophosphatase domain
MSELIVIGTGISSISHITMEAKIAIQTAEKLLYLVGEPLTKQWLEETNPTAEDLHPFYADGKDRRQTYQEMCDHIVKFVRDGVSVCAAFYGHPGIFCAPPHMAIQQLRSEGYRAKMLPGVCAEDCLFADLGVDPARSGCQSFETTDFLLYERRFDPSCSLVLWQVGVIGHTDFQSTGYKDKGTGFLADYLLRFYPPTHKVTIYEAATYFLCEPRIETVPLSSLPNSKVSSISTLYVPPHGIRSANIETLRSLHISEHVMTKLYLTGDAVLSDARFLHDDSRLLGQTT